MFFVLLYGLECCQLNKADLQSLDFTSNQLFMKLFRTGSIDVVQECRSYFGKKQDKFLSRYNCVENLFVDIVISCDLYAVVQRIDFSLLYDFRLSTTADGE